MSPAKMRKFQPYEYSLSSDKQYLLIKRSSRRVFRRSSYGTYDILEWKNGIITHLTPSNWSKSKHDPDEFQVRYVSWAPKGNGLVYVDFDNNVRLFYLRTFE